MTAFKSINFFDLVVEKYEDTSGYVVFSFDNTDGNANIFTFDTKEEFEKYFFIQRHPQYPCLRILPTIITDYQGDTIECVINGIEHYINCNNLYGLINGKILR